MQTRANAYDLSGGINGTIYAQPEFSRRDGNYDDDDVKVPDAVEEIIMFYVDMFL